MAAEKTSRNNLVVALTRIAVWGLLAGTIYLLRSFFLLIFLTFVFAYIQVKSEEKLAARFPTRWVRVALVATLILGVLIAVGAFVAPQVQDQAQEFISQVPEYVQTLDDGIVQAAKRYQIPVDMIPGLREFSESYQQKKSSGEAELVSEMGRSPTILLARVLFGLGDESAGSAQLGYTLEAFKDIGGALLAIGSAFLLSLLLSFLIVLDLPRLTASVVDLANTKVDFIYREVAGGIYKFCQVLGQAFQAQLLIALLNTTLTSIGVVLLGFSDQIVFLAMIVFFCSFIPVAGVFISSIPICLVALQDAGVVMMFLAIAMIVIVHMIETYILNPRIYGQAMRINPVIVLIILTIGGKMFHIWGLILGLPICTYIFGHAIRREET